MDAAMAGAAGLLLKPVAPAVVVVDVLPGAVVVVADAVGLLLNKPRDGVVVAVVVVLVEAGAVVVAGVLLKKLGVGAVEVVDTGAVGLSAPTGAGPKRFDVVVAAEGVAAAPNKFGVIVVVVVGVEAAVAEVPPNRGFCVAVPAPPKMVGVAVAAVVGAAVDARVVWAPPKRFDLLVVGVEAAPNILLIVGVEAAAAPAPNALLVLVVGAAGLAEPPKIFDVPAVCFPKSPEAGVDPALAVENKLGEAAVILSAACVIAGSPNIGTAGFAASAVGVAGLSPPAEELLNNPPAEAPSLFPPNNPEVEEVEAAAGAADVFPKVLDPPPNSVEPPVAPAAPPKAVAAPLPNVGVLVVGVDA